MVISIHKSWLMFLLYWRYTIERGVIDSLYTYKIYNCSLYAIILNHFFYVVNTWHMSHSESDYAITLYKLDLSTYNKNKKDSPFLYINLQLYSYVIVRKYEVVFCYEFDIFDTVIEVKDTSFWNCIEFGNRLTISLSYISNHIPQQPINLNVNFSI